MKEYETLYILAPALTQAAIDNLKSKLEGIVKKDGGHVLIHTDWGKRKLAFSIKKQRNGHYFYFQYISPGGSVAGIERNLKYDENVLRFMTVQLSDNVDVETRSKQEILPPPLAPEYSEERERPPRVQHY
ncbi:MAG: 30S ribosomal protein S6 [Deltaproteobacteria bacterium]|nr:30S ribosomal protein S6 [Deltaproteobacteria bacterium]